MFKMPYISDPTIIPRVQKYLESNEDKSYVDINVMADDLQRMYKDYAKKKRNVFRCSVKKAYAVVLQSYGLNDVNVNLSSEEEISEEEEDAAFGNNSLSNQLLEMYSRKPLVEDELIDISSDDSNDHITQAELEKPANGASTSKLKGDSVSYEKRRPFPVEKAKKRKMEGQLTSTQLAKKKKSVATIQEPVVTFKNIGGMEKILKDVCQLLVHVRHPEVYRQIGISPPRGILLHGPPGSGKTLFANAIAGQLNVPLLKVAATELVAGISGESEERIRELFERAVFSSPCVLFIDEIDAIAPHRQNVQKEMERRIVAQLLSCLDDLNQNENGDRILVIGATNRPDAIDPALRRAGRFDREICLGIPDLKSRVDILKVLTKKLKLAEGFDFQTIAEHTPGFVGADLMSLIRGAAMTAVSRAFVIYQEQRKLEKTLALQKAAQEMIEKQKQAEAKTNCEDEEPKTTEESTENDTNQEPPAEPKTDSPIVVIDDDAKAANAENPDTEVVPQKILTDEEIQQALRVWESKETSLDELLAWLGDEAPLTKERLKNLSITMEDFAVALKTVQPSAKREGFATVPDVTWDDVGSLVDIRKQLQRAILVPMRYPEQCTALGLTAPTGVLLCGPPGCGKTLLAKAVANEAGINFLSVKGPELLNMYMGESERAVRMCFERARNSAPCVIFFDELDSLCPKRAEGGENNAISRVVNQMLTEMDGVQGRQGVYILAATNRPDIIDPAVLRPGRLDKILYVGFPTASDRVDILRAITKNGTKPPLAPDVDLELIGKSEELTGYTGADLDALVKEAATQILDEVMQGSQQQQSLLVTTEHFKRAVSSIQPSVLEKEQKHYEKLKKIYSKCTPEEIVEEMEYS